MEQWVDPLAMPPLRVKTFVALLHTFKKARVFVFGLVVDGSGGGRLVAVGVSMSWWMSVYVLMVYVIGLMRVCVWW